MGLLESRVTLELLQESSFRADLQPSILSRVVGRLQQFQRLSTWKASYLLLLTEMRSAREEAALLLRDPLISKEERDRRRDEQMEAQRGVLQRRRSSSWQKV